MSSPTQRTLKYYRDLGYTCAVVERYCQYSRRRIDLFNFLDIVAMNPAHTDGPGIVGIQATSNNGGNHSAHLAKILAEPKSLVWLQSGGHIRLISWSKRGARGKRKLWTPRIEAITADMFEVLT